MKKYKTILTPSELQVTRCLWNAKEPLTGMQIAEGVQSNQEPMWKPKTIYPLLRSLIDKNMLRDVGKRTQWQIVFTLIQPESQPPGIFRIENNGGITPSGAYRISFLLQNRIGYPLPDFHRAFFIGFPASVSAGAVFI